METKPEMDFFMNTLMDSLFEGAYYVDADNKILCWNQAAERISSYSSEQVVGKRCADNLLCHVDGQGNQLCLSGCPLKSTLTDGLNRQADAFLHHRDGHRVPVQIRVTPVRAEDGQIIGAVEFFMEKKPKRKMVQELERLRNEVFKDELTQIANRKFVLLQMRRHLQELNSLHIPLGVMMVDIDHFKAVNDNYGHNIGDRVLAMVAKTIELSLREFDTVARWGGEEFVALLPGISPEDMKKVSERIRVQIESSWLDLREKKNLQVTVSMGCVLAAIGEKEETLIERADKKMYLAKQQGRNRVVI